VHDAAARSGVLVLQECSDDGAPLERTEVLVADLPAAVAVREVSRPRWVWDDTARRYPPLLEAGVRVERAHDLRLCHAILRRSAHAAGAELAGAPDGPWDEPTSPLRPADAVDSLFDVAFLTGSRDRTPVASPLVGTFDAPRVAPDPGPLAELARQLASVAGSAEPGRLRLLLAAESTGALIAAEMHHDGLPWVAAEHDALLTRLLGPRPPAGRRPTRLERLVEQIRIALGRPGLNPDSQPELLRALRSAGLDVTSTRVHELRELVHPVTVPLLEYKKLARLLSANGWVWMEAWAADGRFRPDYVPGGVVTGRWASSGGGALQLPKEVRAAVRADEGWRLVVADAAQVEPRVLAAMSADGAMAAAGRAADLYQGVVDAGIVETRQQAKVAMLGAIYGATTGASAALMPQLTRAFPRAIALVEDAARAGERGEVVSTWLGRSSPVPGTQWQAVVLAAATEGAQAEDAREARRRRRDWGRFTRNFVVQGTAAEWALCWMAALRRRLLAIEGRPHLVFFLHDEVIVHAPDAVTGQVVEAVQEAAAEAGRLLFGGFPVDFALDVCVVDAYDQAT